MAAAGVLPVGVYEAQAKSAGKRSHHASRLQDVVPTPVEAKATPTNYSITSDSTISIQSEKAREVAEYLAGILRPSTGYELPVVEGPARGPAGGISLRLVGASDDVGNEGYRLNVTPHGVTIRANQPAGLFNGVQTLRQLLPAAVESDIKQSVSWPVPGGRIRDYPRFDHRRVMLDVARHFFPIEEVKKFIDEISLYKINDLHLHLTDDQGWRIEIDSWPKLTEIGGSSGVGCDRPDTGGYYTKTEYKEIVDYAQVRNITIIPEIDMPGHTRAALASYAKLNCDGTAPPLYCGTDVGFSSLCIGKEITYEFVDDVIREVAAMTPGSYIHIGGDEAYQTTEEDYKEFMAQAISIVQKYGKRAIGWQRSGSGILDPNPPNSTVAQYWGEDHRAPESKTSAKQGHELILSPSNFTYLDVEYNENTERGSTWTGRTSVKNSYSWNPGSYISGVSESSVLGPEAAIWSDNFTRPGDGMDLAEFFAFPRLAAIAELAWSPWSTHNWQQFKHRLAAQGPRWDVLDINYYRSPQVPWPQ